MPPAFPDARLLRAGISAARVAQLRTAYDAMTASQQGQLRQLVASRPDEILRRTYDPAGIPTAPTTTADVVADPALLTAVQTAILTAHDTDTERETFTPARLADTALRAAFGSRLGEAHDDFGGKPNGVLTALDSGQGYELYANDPATAFAVTGGHLTHTLRASGPSAAYAGAQLGDRVGRIWANFVIPSGAGTAEDLVLIVSADRFAQPTFSDAAAHFVLSQNDWSYQTLTANPWATPVVASGAFDAPLATDVVHTVAIDFLGDRAAITLPGGHRPVLTPATARILTSRGDHATIELFANDSATAKPIRVQAWGADTEAAIVAATPFATRADIARALDPVPPAPRTTYFAATPGQDFPITTTPTQVNAAISVLLEYPASGRVRWDFAGYFWPSSGTTYGTGVYVWLMNGATVRGGGQIALNIDGEGFYRFTGVLTGTPGTSQTLTFAVSAGAGGAANFTTDDARGLAAVLSATPLAA